MKPKKIHVAFVALTLSILAFPKVARADDKITVSSVGFANASWGHTLWVTGTNGKTYYAYLGGGGGSCPTVTIDDVKIYESLATAAYLSGRQLTVAFNTSTCGGVATPTITGIFSN